MVTKLNPAPGKSRQAEPYFLKRTIKDRLSGSIAPLAISMAFLFFLPPAVALAAAQVRGTIAAISFSIGIEPQFKVPGASENLRHNLSLNSGVPDMVQHASTSIR
jgi:hypothetical protein